MNKPDLQASIRAIAVKLTEKFKDTLRRNDPSASGVSVTLSQSSQTVRLLPQRKWHTDVLPRV